jgi:hypothetical protein
VHVSWSVGSGTLGTGDSVRHVKDINSWGRVSSDKPPAGCQGLIEALIHAAVG